MCSQENSPQRIRHKEHKERKEEEGNVLIYVFFVFSVATPIGVAGFHCWLRQAR